MYLLRLYYADHHKIPKAESRNAVFSGLYVEKTPGVIVYDFSCQLGDYSISRDPEFFKDD